MTTVHVRLPAAIDKTALHRDGFAIVPDAVSSARVNDVLDALPSSPDRTGRGGLRNLFEIPAITDLAQDPTIRGIAESVLGPSCFAVRVLLFDKTASTNWKVAWHQDLTIAVAERRDVPGFGPWSVKAGVAHVQPPTEILERMLAVRLHLDACGPDNGPVRVIPGSHRGGRLSSETVELWRRRVESVTCVVPRGGLLVMRPLLLHASSPATAPAHRRVVHFEFATGSLPGGLVWKWQV